MQITLLILFLVVSAFLFAKVEIAIEGAKGWAENLPTWKLPGSHWLGRLFFGGRPATGYHASVIPFLFIILHFPFAFQNFSYGIELKIISFFILLLVTEDFLWFVLNPAFGIRSFKKQNIWWHEKNWWGFAPREYFIFIPIAAILFYLSLKVS